MAMGYACGCQGPGGIMARRNSGDQNRRAPPTPCAGVAASVSFAMRFTVSRRSRLIEHLARLTVVCSMVILLV